MEPALTSLAILVGVLAGVLSGLFGIGGGLVVVPAAIFLFGTGFHDAKAASLIVIVVSAATSLWKHRGAGNVDLRLGATLGAAGAVAGLVGVYIAEVTPEFYLRLLFAALLVVAAARMRVRIEPRHNPPDVPLTVSLPVGFVAGLMPGLLGVGGGIVVVPALVYYGVGIHAAVGASLAAVLVNGATAGIGQLAVGFDAVALEVGIPMALGAFTGGMLGAKTGLKTGSKSLSDAFSILLLLVAASVAYSAFRAG
ncbi:MAG: sulfite exporter TauE/SafE family protein [Euryarchaeota archaeon]|nr:sulfite exporter TauE/SafE family protein [Euryarchaeota archaeon]